MMYNARPARLNRLRLEEEEVVGNHSFLFHKTLIFFVLTGLRLMAYSGFIISSLSIFLMPFFQYEPFVISTHSTYPLIGCPIRTLKWVSVWRDRTHWQRWTQRPLVCNLFHINIKNWNNITAFKKRPVSFLKK